MRLGLIDRYLGPALALSLRTQAATNFKPGQWLQLRSDDHGTEVIRQIKFFNLTSGIADFYVYTDAETLRYLCADPHDEVEVRVSDLDLDFP